MEFTGERYVPELNIDSEITIYHLQRYLSALDFCKGKIVLDAACGEGYGSNMISDVAKHTTGIDISENAIANAKEKYKKDNLKYIQASIEQLPLEDNSVDVIVSFETIEHVTSELQDKFLKEISRVLKPDGVLIMSSPDKKNYSDIPQFSNEYHVKEFYHDEFCDFLKREFQYIDLYYQGTYCNSYIYNEQTDIAKINKSLYLRNPDESRAEYIIAVCGNREIENKIDNIVLDASNKYYHLNEEINKLKANLGEPGKIIEQKENYICEQRQMLSEKDKVIQELKGITEQNQNYINELKYIVDEQNKVLEKHRRYLNKPVIKQALAIFKKAKGVN